MASPLWLSRQQIQWTFDCQYPPLFLSIRIGHCSETYQSNQRSLPANSEVQNTLSLPSVDQETSIASTTITMQLKAILLILTPILGLVAANPVAAPAAAPADAKACSGWCGGGTVSRTGQLYPSVNDGFFVTNIHASVIVLMAMPR